MPQATDPDSHSDLVYSFISASYPSYVAFDNDNKMFTFSPTLTSNIAINEITINVRDGDSKSPGTSAKFDVKPLIPANYTSFP